MKPALLIATAICVLGTFGCNSCGGPHVFCGNGVREQWEECDDGDNNSDTVPDACRLSCRLPSCGDGVVDPYEECDWYGDPLCDQDCIYPVCGDGRHSGGEECDDGAMNSDTEPNACRLSCQLPHCGDGVLDDGWAYAEVCDDGNYVSGDGCSDLCVLDRCGDGVLDTLEGCDDGNLQSHDWCSSVCQPETVWWSTGGYYGQVVSDHAMTWDASRNRLVLFGGLSVGTLRVATREYDAYDGSHWTQVAVTSNPGFREWPAMCFFPPLGLTILFGGLSGGPLQDTWAYDGADWTQLTTASSPPARSQHRLVYDSARSRLVLFGGTDGVGPLGDTWAFDGADWTEVQATSSPPPGRLPAMAYDPDRERVVLYGRVDSTAVEGTWELDGNQWSLVAAVGPQSLFENVMVYYPTAGRIVLVAGSDETLELWQYDGAAWARLPSPSGYIASPDPMIGFRVVHDPPSARLLLCGGRAADTMTTYGNLWSIRPTSDWTDEYCEISGDEDRDGLTDCADPDCILAPPCQP